MRFPLLQDSFGGIFDVSTEGRLFSPGAGLPRSQGLSKLKAFASGLFRWNDWNVVGILYDTW